ncbi:MAG: molybdopterin molybdenumtransferase MoeA [Rhodobacterales bacterium]|nr:molybdopterin molybdenumtransferase MoeA [Rhodobacterales bacterium]
MSGSVTTDLTPPRLRNDCFAMPQGVDWVPVDAALDRLRAGLHAVTAVEQLPVAQALGRVLAAPVVALRSNPPQANSAVDGYGFAQGATGEGVQRLPLVAGRAAAGQPLGAAVPHGHAVRILTGAILPEGVDTVVLEEDCATDGRTVAFDGPVKARINTRRAGEDVAAGAEALPQGRALGPADLALLTALGVAQVAVRRRLRVAVLSTGDELLPDPGMPALPHQIYDANRPMLLALIAGWGFDPVDLGHAPDDAATIAARLDAGAAAADVILTSGGASAGDEDHVSRLLRQHGQLSSWRIAVKPGRPLALALWRGVPVFGLPGNPVAAFTCALVFARPALSMLSGAGWRPVPGFAVPAAFAKVKKAGRREFLRARLDDQGRAEVFRSEGSGRISGLSWATGFVELPDAACTIAPGDPVRFVPYASFGVSFGG